MIIKSLLDTDFYKLAVMFFAYKTHPKTVVNYSFTCRTKGVDFSSIYEDLIKEIHNVSSLSFAVEEIQMLKKKKGHVFDDDFFALLQNFKLNKDHVSVSLNEKGELVLNIKGLWHETTLWEIYLLAIVNELYFQKNYAEKGLVDFDKAMYKLEQGIKLIKSNNKNDFKFIEFGSRRRFSSEWQEIVLKKLIKELPKNLIGTSNVLLGIKNNLKIIGTHPHECLAVYQIYGFSQSQPKFLTDWYNVFGEELSISLTDIYNTDTFLKYFDKELTEKFAGLRQDSGDPIVWFSKIEKHYETLGIDLKNKKMVFSDSLDFSKALTIHSIVSGKTQDSYGIGTYLTNNVVDKNINIVIKLVKADGVNTVKISDEPQKAIGDDEQKNKVLKWMKLNE